MHYHFDFAALVPYAPQFARGVWLTVRMTVVALLFGFVLGVACAVARRSGPPWLARLCAGYVEVTRNTPFLVQIFIVYFGLATLGVKLPTFVAASLAMVVNVGAYSSEIVRAGIESIHRGQLEAGECLGLSRAQIYLHVVLGPAIERVFPALTSQFTLMMLATSVTSQISAEELTAVANTVQSDTFRSFETYIVVAALYLALAATMRIGLWLLGQGLFPRRRLVRARG
jgi:polar amino acid transport system permease protein